MQAYFTVPYSTPHRITIVVKGYIIFSARSNFVELLQPCLIILLFFLDKLPFLFSVLQPELRLLSQVSFVSVFFVLFVVEPTEGLVRVVSLLFDILLSEGY